MTAKALTGFRRPLIEKNSCSSVNILVLCTPRNFYFRGSTTSIMTEIRRLSMQPGGPMVSLTDGAVKQFKTVVEKQGKAGDGVRIFVVPGG